MKRTNIILILIAMLSLLGLGAVLIFVGDSGQETQGGAQSSLADYQNNYMENLGANKEILVTVLEDFSKVGKNGIYDLAFQESVREKIDGLIAENAYDEDMPLVIYNPFLTNSQSLYVYFETQQPYSVSYSIHLPEEEYKDFKGNVVPNDPTTSYVHEFQITGLIPDTTNMITLRLTDQDGRVIIRRFYYYNENTVEASAIQLKVTQGTKVVANEDKTVSTVPASEDSVAGGMFVTFPVANEVSPYLRIYDNDGVQRAELPLEEFGTKNMLFADGMMYYKVSETKIVGLNCLGQAEVIYTAEGYTFGEDYCLDKNEDILVIAGRQSQKSSDDIILLIERATGEVTELVDMGNLLSEYKDLCRAAGKEAEWLHLNSIDLVDGNRILVSDEATGTIIKIRRLYNDPRIAFMVGDAEIFKETSYAEEYFLRVDNEFEMHHNLSVVKYQEYDMIRESRHYIYLLNTNEDMEYGKKEEPYAYYYRYLVDEAEFGVRLKDSFVIPAVAEDGSIQWYGNHLLVNGDLIPEFHEYDSEFQLIATYRYVEPVVKKTEEQLEYEEDNPPADATVLFARVLKFDFLDYYFTEEPVIILPVESETDVSEEK